MIQLWARPIVDIWLALATKGTRADLWAEEPDDVVAFVSAGDRTELTEVLVLAELPLGFASETQIVVLGGAAGEQPSAKRFILVLNKGLLLGFLWSEEVFYAKKRWNSHCQPGDNRLWSFNFSPLDVLLKEKVAIFEQICQNWFLCGQLWIWIVYRLLEQLEPSPTLLQVCAEIRTRNWLSSTCSLKL